MIKGGVLGNFAAGRDESRLALEPTSLVEQPAPGAPLLFGESFNEAEGYFIVDLYEDEPRI